MREKRKINGVKDTEQNYKGNAYGTIKKVIALVLSAGMLITAAEALRMYNQWRDSKIPGTEVSDQKNVKDVSFEDVKKLVEEYREAKRNNDTEKIKSLDLKLSQGNYFEVLFGNFKEQMVESLGFDPERVEIVIARNGTFLVDKEKAKDKAVVDHTGQISSSVKYIDETGKNPKVPRKMQNMVSLLGTDVSVAKYKKMVDLESHYSNFEYLLEYEPEIDGDERE